MNRRLRAVWTSISRVFMPLGVRNPDQDFGIGHFRGALAAGLDPDLVNRIADAFVDATGLDLCCIWDTHDAVTGLRGNPELFIRDARGGLHDVPDALLQWLLGADDAADDDIIFPSPEKLRDMPWEMVVDTFDYDDRRHNIAVTDAALHCGNLEPTPPRVNLSDLA